MEPVKRRGKLLSMAEVLGKTLERRWRDGRDGEMEDGMGSLRTSRLDRDTVKPERNGLGKANVVG